MKETEPRNLTRDCVAIEIPAGTTTLLPMGMPVYIQQSLGGTFTVFTATGQMVRISGKDADAMGLDPLTPDPTAAPAGPPGSSPRDIEKAVWDQLRTVYDPEIPVNVVDLGLVYSCRVMSLPDLAYRVEVTMTLTAPGCGMGDVLRADAESKIQGVHGVEEASVQMVVEPPWDRAMMSEAAKLQLGML